MLFHLYVIDLLHDWVKSAYTINPFTADPLNTLHFAILGRV